MDFINPRYRDRPLASDDRIDAITRGVVTIKLNDTAISKLRAKDVKWRSQGFTAAQQQGPNRKSKSGVREGN